jgi:hypothetical protein
MTTDTIEQTEACVLDAFYDWWESSGNSTLTLCPTMAREIACSAWIASFNRMAPSSVEGA